MAQDSTIILVQNMLDSILTENPEVFIVQVKIKPTNNIKVFIDTDTGISIETCIKINRKLYRAIEEAATFPEGDFSLEVSSPGLGEPILLLRQYKKSVGRHLSVILQNDNKIEGLLATTTDDGIVIEELKGKGKKQETISHSILFDDIKKAVVEVKF
jgi:ribosome maturation factor RimP